MLRQEWTPEQLCGALAEPIRPDEASLTAFQQGLAEIAHRHHLRKAEQGTGRRVMVEQLARIRDAFDAVVRALEAADPRVRLLLGYGSPWASAAPRIEALRSERDNASGMLRLVEFGGEVKVENRTRIPDDTKPSTYLCRELRGLYVALTGNAAIGNGGPLYKFARRCAAMIDPELAFPGPDALRKAVGRGGGH
jgi:hypothetical protein